MSDPVNGGNGNPGQSPKEMSMEVRLLLAFLLMGAVMFVTPYLPYFKNAKPPAGKVPEPTATAPITAGQISAPAGTPEAEVTAQAQAPSASATPQQPLPNFVIETDLYKISFSNQGATIRSWILKGRDAKERLKFKGNDGKPLSISSTPPPVRLVPLRPRHLPKGRLA